MSATLAYVGMTRATDHLSVVTRDGHPLAEDLRKAGAAYPSMDQASQRQV